MALLLFALLAAAAPGGVNAPPQRAGQCRWVYGRYAVYNGAGVRRIRLTGTRRIINLFDDDEDVPPAIERYTREADHGTPGVGLYGDFYVCAREHSRPGHMQHVRLLRTRNLVYRGRSFPAR
jgi:hypothetical protein